MLQTPPSAAPRSSIRTILLFAIALGALAACVPGPSGDISPSLAGDDVPIVEVIAPEADTSSLTFDIDFVVYDRDSDEVILWDKCPYPDAEDAAPILRIGFSADGGPFQPIDPADLLLDGDPLEVPTCAEVEKFDSDFRIAAANSGEQFTLTWDSLDYVPTSAFVVFRVAANDGSFTSDPGDSEEFEVANLPTFRVTPRGMRPNETRAVTLRGTLTHWGGTTVVTSSQQLTFTVGPTFTSTTAGTATLQHGSNTDQRPRLITLTTPGEGIPTGDEIAPGRVWTCPGIGQPVVEYETESIGGIAQFVCDQGDFTIGGSLLAGEFDAFTFVANSAGLASMSMNWTSSNGAETDYDVYMVDSNGELMTGAEPYGLGPCGTEDKPENCTLTTALVAGEEYTVVVSHYSGETANDGVTYTVTVDPP